MTLERSYNDETRQTRLTEEIEFAKNPEQRCACILLLDVSGSMNGAPINALNAGIRQFYQELQQDDLAALRVDLAIVPFNHEVAVKQDFTTVTASPQPPQLQAGGGTNMCQAINKAMSMLDERKQAYRRQGVSYYRPWVIFITDGEPNDRNLVRSTGQAVQQAYDERHLSFFAIGTEDADFQVLTQLAPRQAPPKKLSGIKFRKFFQWLSASLTKVSQSNIGQQVAMPSTGAWETTQA